MTEEGIPSGQSTKMDDGLADPGSKGGTGDHKPSDTQHDDGGCGRDQEEIGMEELLEDEPEGIGKSLRKSVKMLKSCFTGSASTKDKGVNTPSSVSPGIDSSGTATGNQLETNVSKCDTDEYDFSHPRRGRAIIINNEKFRTLPKRPGSACDGKALKDMFTKLGFDVKCYNDLTATEIKMELNKEAASYDHANADCLAVAILSHGDKQLLKDMRGHSSHLVQQDLILGVDGNPIFTSSIMRTFQDSRCPGLIGKPRLFFLQACRGEKHDDGLSMRIYKDWCDQTDAAMGKQPKQPDQSAADIPMCPNAAVDASNTEPKETFHNDAVNAMVDLSSVVKLDENDAATTILEVTQSGISPSLAAVDLSSVNKQGLTDATGKAAEDLDTEETDVAGSMEDDDSDDDEPDASGKRPVTKRLMLSPAPIFKDYLVMYATTPGHFAWRRKTGSWFVQSLHSVFMKHYNPRNMTLFQALTSVIRMVALGYESESSDPQYQGKKQIPVIQHMLVKDVYFSPKK